MRCTIINGKGTKGGELYEGLSKKREQRWRGAHLVLGIVPIDLALNFRGCHANNQSGRRYR